MHFGLLIFGLEVTFDQARVIAVGQTSLGALEESAHDFRAEARLSFWDVYFLKTPFAPMLGFGLKWELILGLID